MKGKPMTNSSRVTYVERSIFPDGTDFENIECADGTLLADVLKDGERVEVVVVGPCPHHKEK